MTDQQFEPKANTKIGMLLAAMRAVAAERPIWTADEAAKAMGVPRSTVPPYLVSALSHKLLHRRMASGSYELSLQPFLEEPAQRNYTPYVPPKASAPRPGSDIRHVNPPRPVTGRVEHPPSEHKLCPGCERSQCRDHGCVIEKTATPQVPPRPAPAPTPAPTPSPTPAPTPAPTPQPTPAPTAAPKAMPMPDTSTLPKIPRFNGHVPGAGTASTEPAAPAAAAPQVHVGERPGDGMVGTPAANAPEFDAWYSVRTKRLRLVGVKVEEDGSVLLTEDQLEVLREAWAEKQA